MENNDVITAAFAAQGIKTQAELDAISDKNTRYFQVGEDTYKLGMIKGRKGVSIALKLKSIALPLLGRAVDGLKDEDDFMTEAPKTFTDMAVLLNHSMEEADIESLIFDSILYDVSIKKGERYEKIDWDEFLVCNYSVLIPLLTFALKENFESFFTGNGMMTGILEKARNLLG